MAPISTDRARKMASLSRIVRAKNKAAEQLRSPRSRTENVKINTLTPAMLPDFEEKSLEEELHEVTIAAPEEEQEEWVDFKNVMFVANCKLTKNMKDTLGDFSNIRSFDYDLFANRSCEQLLHDFEVCNIWVNVSSSKARQWLCKQLLHNESYTVVVCYKYNKKGKWISDMESTGKVKTICKISDISNLKSLSHDELIKSLNGSFTLHHPGSPLALMCGISRMLTKSQKN